MATSRRVLDEALETGTAILDSLSGQRDRLKVAPIPVQCPALLTQ